MISTQTVLPFNLESEVQENITRFSGLPLVAEAFRALGLDRECLKRMQFKERERGLNSAQMVESFLMLFARHLGAGVLPSKYFGMNAAYYRLNVLCLNLLQAIKLLTLDEELRYARPKRLRFLLFSMAGRIVKHARKIVLRVSSSAPGYQMYRHSREQLAVIATTTAAESI